MTGTMQSNLSLCRVATVLAKVGSVGLRVTVPILRPSGFRAAAIWWTMSVEAEMS